MEGVTEWPSETKKELKMTPTKTKSNKTKDITTMSTAVKQSPITRTVFDLDTFESVTLTKNVPDFVPAENTTEVLTRIGNDHNKMLELLNAGLKAAERDSVESNKEIPFLAAKLDDDGEETEELIPYTGTPANPEKVNALKLTLAKTVFGYNKSMSKDEKKVAKESAIAMIKDTPAIKAGLQKSAATV